MNFDCITTDPARMNRRPCIRSLRLAVRPVLEIDGSYPDRDAIRRDYPEIGDEDIRQALGYAATLIDDAIIELPRRA
jgi:uncharacterized protein (DUF433 family)